MPSGKPSPPPKKAPALNLTVDEYDEDYHVNKDRCIDKRAFPILNDYIQPNSQTSLATASAAILKLVPDNLQRDDPGDKSIMSLGRLCLELSEQIPYSHPAQLRLVRLLQHVAQSPKVVTFNTPLHMFGQVIRDDLDSVDPKDPTPWVNFISFVAKFETLVWPTKSPIWSVWAMKDAFEHDPIEAPPAWHEAKVIAAAQYILYGGQDLLLQIACPGDVTGEDVKCWATGPRYKGPPSLDLARWWFWRDGFVAAGEGEGANRKASTELKSVADRTVALMDALVAATPGLTR